MEYEEFRRRQVEDLRKLSWRLCEWHSQPALFGIADHTLQRFHGQPFDRSQFKVVENGWDHDHCELCWAKITDLPGLDAKHFGEAYTDGGDQWLCQPCFERVIRRGEAPEW
jgi:hypothetical protein